MIVNEMIAPSAFQINESLNPDWSSYVYGEIHSQSLIDILITMNCDNRHLLDIGSGTGRLIADLHDSFEHLSLTGIEIDVDRYNTSLHMENHRNDHQYMEFLCGDFRELYFGNYDILYCCNCVFEIEDNDALFDKIIREFKGHCFLFSFDKKMVPYYVRSYIIQTSWVPYTEIYHFSL